jgi:hypothetical protein
MIPGTDLQIVTIIPGILAGIAAGVIMGLVSEVGYRLSLFKSSLLIVDGSFLIRSLPVGKSKALLYSAGIPVHLITSGLFGGAYAAICTLLRLEPFSAFNIAFYFFVLWLSMLFIALPVAGQGLLGRRLGDSTWVEQLVLHVVFGVGYFGSYGMLLTY